MPFNHYARKFQKLNIAKNKKIGAAPHKPVLMLSVIDLIESGHIRENKIAITPELVATFKELWSLLVTTPHKLNFALPFYHLRSDKFWHLVTYPGAEIAITASRSIKSLSALKMAVMYATLDEELFQVLSLRPENRDALKSILLDTYFPNTKQHYFNVKGKFNSYWQQIEHAILAEPQESYQRQLDLEDQEDLFVRGGVFKKTVPQIYNFTCAVSGFRIETTDDSSLVDACHIVPWSRNHDDTITNGITLCPNLHRAFDRGLFTIDEDYRFRISQHFTESHSPYNLHQFEGREVVLPSQQSYWPDPANFREKLRQLGVAR